MVPILTLTAENRAYSTKIGCKLGTNTRISLRPST